MLEIERFILNFVISGSAAIISKTLLAPVERAKLILQTQTSAYQVLTGQTKPYAGLIDLFCRVPIEQGIWSLWRGNAANVIRYFPSQALNFSFYDAFSGFLHTHIAHDTSTRRTMCKITAGGFAGACSTTIVFPLHFCQTRLSVDMGADAKCNKVPREFNGLNSCVYTIFKREGIRGLYRGVLVSTFGIAVYRGFYFGLFDLTKEFYKGTLEDVNPNRKPPTVILFMMAQVVTSLSGFIAYPLDTISRHMMMNAGRTADIRTCATVFGTAKYIKTTLGYTGFYLGALTNVLRCTASALVLVLYDEFLYYSDWKEKLKKYMEE